MFSIITFVEVAVALLTIAMLGNGIGMGGAGGAGTLHTSGMPMQVPPPFDPAGIIALAPFSCR
ncbi:hypothetical protein [Sorangium sp. So ce854]|uniref:hypothetical protein n=1 Tax=Sorangium sp. So ce854 TaxID=3133322 RepID=UPI003F6059A2